MDRSLFNIYNYIKDKNKLTNEEIKKMMTLFNPKYRNTEFINIIECILYYIELSNNNLINADYFANLHTYIRKEIEQDTVLELLHNGDFLNALKKIYCVNNYFNKLEFKILKKLLIILKENLNKKHQCKPTYDPYFFKKDKIKDLINPTNSRKRYPDL